MKIEVIKIDDVKILENHLDKIFNPSILLLCFSIDFDKKVFSAAYSWHLRQS